MRNNKIIAVDVNTGVKDTIDNTIKAKQRSLTKEYKDNLLDIIRYGGEKSEPVFVDNASEGLFLRNMVTIARFALGTKKDVEYLFALLKDRLHDNQSRQYRLMALVIASINPIVEVKHLFRRAFQTLITNEEDLCDFTTAIKSGVIRGYGKTIQHATSEKIKSFDVEQFLLSAKRSRIRDYDGETRRIDSFTLSDVIALAHTKPGTDKEKALFKALIKGDVSDANLPVEYNRYIEYTIANDVRRAQILSSDVVFSTEAIMNNAPGKLVTKFACLHANVSEIVKYFKNFYDFELLTKDVECIKYVSQSLSNEKLVLEAKLLPTAFFGLADAFPLVKTSVLSALYSAAEISYENMLPIDDKLLMFVDEGATMEQTFSTGFGRSQGYKLLANTLCAMLYKKATDAEIIPYIKKVESISLDKTMSTVAISDLLTQGYRGVTEDNVVPFKYLAENKPQAKCLIFINADKSWARVLTETQAGNYLSEYLSSLDYVPVMYFINLKYGDLPNVNRLPNSYFVPSYDKRLFTHILQHVSNHTGLLKELDKIVF